MWNFAALPPTVNHDQHAIDATPARWRGGAVEHPTHRSMATQVARVRAASDGDFLAQLANHKAVYVAPLKALAQEVVSKFSERLGNLGIQVRELTGDVQLTRR